MNPCVGPSVRCDRPRAATAVAGVMSQMGNQGWLKWGSRKLRFPNRLDTDVFLGNSYPYHYYGWGS